MNQAISDALLKATNAYANTPTGENRENLIRAADEYREAWIVAQASGNGSKAKLRMPTAMYDRRLEVARIVDDIPVKLALQERVGGDIEKPWWTLSWRTKYSAGSSNRRFYMAKGDCWVIPAAIALEMIEEMESRGGLGEGYFDHRGMPSLEPLVSTEMTGVEKADALEGITGPDEDWGADPFFVICPDPSSQWKKVLLINSETNVATFRSITENPDYMPKKVLRPNVSWWLDNSMMDANVQQMLVFYSLLKKYLSRE